jgi:hypothetical protein
MRNGYTISGNATVEHEFPGSINLRVSYVANNGVGLYNTTYPNAYTGAEPQYAPYSQVNPGVTPGTTALGLIGLYYNGGYSSYNALQVQARKNSPSHGIQFQAAYTWAKDMTDSDDLWSASPTSGAVVLNNPRCLKCEYAPASYSVSQRFVGNFEYELPFGRVGGLPKKLTQGWKALGILNFQTGFPFTVMDPYGTLQDGFNGTGVRPFLLQKATKNTAGGSQFFSNAVIAGTQPGINDGTNPNFFGIPTTTSPYLGGATVQTMPGNLGRNTFTSPSWSNVDFSIIKDTRISESKSLQFRAEFFNLLNQATFGPPHVMIGDPIFGTSSYTATTERQIQFAVRFIF